MKIVVIGGTGNVGTKLVTRLREHGHDVMAASRRTGVDIFKGEGVERALAGQDVVVDVSQAPSFEPTPVMEYFTRSTRNLLMAEAAAGIKHHVVLSVVGSDRLTDSAYLRAKLAQERLVEESSIPYSIVRATQFFEFVKTIAAVATREDKVFLAPVLIQPVAIDDVVKVVGKVSVGAPLNGMIDVAGPEQFRLDELVRQGLAAHSDGRAVVTDPNARYFGAALDERTLVPSGEARLGEIHFQDWLS